MMKYKISILIILLIVTTSLFSLQCKAKVNLANTTELQIIHQKTETAQNQPLQNPALLDKELTDPMPEEEYLEIVDPMPEEESLEVMDSMPEEESLTSNTSKKTPEETKRESINNQDLPKQDIVIKKLQDDIRINKQLTCETCGVKNLSINNMPSSYTNIMVDGVRINPSNIQSYNFEMLDKNNFDSISVTNGTNSNIANPDSISNGINFISKKPKSNKIDIKVSKGNYGTKEININTDTVFKGGSLRIDGTTRDKQGIDADKNGIVEMPNSRNRNFNSTIYLDNVLGFTVNSSLNIAQDYRYNNIVRYNYTNNLDNNNTNNGKVNNGGDTTCPAGTELYNDQCVASCPKGQSLGEKGTCLCNNNYQIAQGEKCVDCLNSDEIRNSDNKCVKAKCSSPTNQTLFLFKGSCYSCQDNETFDPNNKQCNCSGNKVTWDKIDGESKASCKKYDYCSNKKIGSGGKDCNCASGYSILVFLGDCRKGMFWGDEYSKVSKTNSSEPTISSATISVVQLTVNGFKKILTNLNPLSNTTSPQINQNTIQSNIVRNNINTTNQKFNLEAERKTSFGSFKLISNINSQKQKNNLLSNWQSDQIYLENSYKISSKIKEIEEIFLGVSQFTQKLKYSNNLQNDITNSGYNYKNTALFGQINNSFLLEKIKTSVASRIDNYKQFGKNFTHKINATLNHNNNLISKIGFATGSKTPMASFGDIAGNNNSNIKLEKTKIFNYDTSYKNQNLEIGAGYNRNTIANITKIDSENNLANSHNLVVIENYNIRASYPIFETTTAKIEAQHSRFNFETGDLPLAMPNYKAFLTLDQQLSKNFAVNIKTNWSGSQDLDKFYGIRYNIDGSRKKSKSPNFFTLDSGANLKINKNHSVTFGADNITNYIQSRIDSQMAISNNQLMFNNIWGPNLGRYIYINYTINI